MKTSSLYKQSRSIKSWIYIVLLLINVFLFICIGAAYLTYIDSYNNKLFDKNVNNVQNLNIASANAAYTYIDSMCIKINDVINYIELNNLSVDETIKYLSESNTNPDRQFQLVLCGRYGNTDILSYGDYSGVSIRKTVQSDGSRNVIINDILYGSGYFDILKSFTDINDQNNHSFTPEFTDPDTKLKCFAAYHHVTLTDSNQEKGCYAVLLAINSQTALNTYNMQNKYIEQSTVLINENGDYIIKNSDYRNTNFFDYIINYNGLTLDYKSYLQNEVFCLPNSEKQTSNLFYKNHRGIECIFSTAVMNNGWYSVTCVPLSSFNLEDDSVNYSQMILILFLILFCIDGIAIFFIGRTMNYNIKVAENATFEANQANQAKSRFLSTMTHELRTPLNAIIGFASLSRDNTEDRSILNDYLNKIDISSKFLLQLISDILDVSAIESSKMKITPCEFNLSKLITSLSTIYYDQCSGKGIEFEVFLKDITSEVLIGDSVRINQILLNFLSNAVKFTPSGGNVTLNIETIKRASSSLTIRFDVRDTGCGINAELMTRLFKPFERVAGEAAHKYRGTGLGLSIAKNLTELMGGRISVESIEGKGSCFSCEIPFDIAATKPCSFNPIENLRILAVSSSEAERAHLDQILSNLCTSHVMADTVENALVLLHEENSSQIPINLCILDWKMSDYCSLEAASKIRSEYDSLSLKIIILAYDLAEVKYKALDAGADYVFAKPVFASELFNTLEEITSGNTMVLPDIKQSVDFSGMRALLVEDNSINTEIALLMLNQLKLDAETAENGKIGYDKFISSSKDYYNVILMDVQMPVMNGYEATIAIRSSSHPNARTIPILAMTADAFSSDVEMSLEAGMNEHISKPIEPTRLRDLLVTYLTG